MWKCTCMYTCVYGMCVWVQMCPSMQECKFVCCMCRCASKYVYLCRYSVCICVNVCAGMHVRVHSDEWEGYGCVCIGLQTFLFVCALRWVWGYKQTADVLFSNSPSCIFQKSLSVNVELTVLTSPAAMDTLDSFCLPPRTKIPGMCRYTWHLDSM